MDILGVNIDNFDKREVLQEIEGFLSGSHPHWIATINPEIALRARKDKEYSGILNQADLRVADGVGLSYASWFFGDKLRGRVMGSDLVYDILKLVSLKKGCRVMIVGTRLSVRKQAAINLKEEFPDINLKVSSFDYDIKKCDAECRDDFLSEKREVEEFGAQIVFVAYGAPYQEQWIHRSIESLPQLRLAIGIGGAIDMVAGKTPRAPRFLRWLGLEWLWRLFLEPRRIKRVFNAVIVFPFFIIKSKLTR